MIASSKVVPMREGDRSESVRTVDLLASPETQAERAQIKAIRKLPNVAFMMSKGHPIRRLCINIYFNPWFDRFIIFVILLNCLVLAIYDPLHPDSIRNRIGDESEIFFTVIFTIEMVIKLFALSAFGRNSYFADRWNWIDSGVVFIGYLSFTPLVSNLSALRTFRVLRPLRTLTSIEGMRIIVNSMLSSIPALVNVMLLCAFIFVIFGIIGVQLWSGVLHGRCHYYDPFRRQFYVHPDDIFCRLPCNIRDPNGKTGDDGAASEEVEPSCNSWGQTCPDLPTRLVVPDNFTATSITQTLDGEEILIENLNTSCMFTENPNYGFTGFDNIGMASLTIFTAITLEGWVDIMYALNGAWGIPVFTAIYFVLLIMFGSFFLLNLALAVIWEEYERAEQENSDKKARDKLLAKKRAAALEAFNRRSGLRSSRQSSRASMSREIALSRDSGSQLNPSGAATPPTPSLDQELHRRKRQSEAARSTANTKQNDDDDDDDDDDNKINSPIEKDVEDQGLDEGGPDAASPTPIPRKGGTIEMVPVSQTSPSPTNDPHSEVETPKLPRRKPLKTDYRKSATLKNMGGFQSERELREQQKQQNPNQRQNSALHHPHKTPWQRFVLSRNFELFVTAFIILNTIALGTEHYNMSEDLATVLVMLNYVFTAVFTIEMVLKLYVLGFRRYVRSKFNVFDACVVFLSFVEIVLAVTPVSAGSGLSALRAFRLLRVFKLAKAWVDLRRLLTTIAKSIADVANASVVLVIVMFIFVLLGMQLFGGTFTNAFDDDDRPRAHFDNFWWAFVTVFQVLTGENWNEVLYNSMHAAGDFVAVVYFVALNLFGNYLILNLFLAILLGNFESSSNEAKAEKDPKKPKGPASSPTTTDNSDSRSTSSSNSTSSDSGSPVPAVVAVAPSSKRLLQQPPKVSPSTQDIGAGTSHEGLVDNSSSSSSSNNNPQNNNATTNTASEHQQAQEPQDGSASSGTTVPTDSDRMDKTPPGNSSAQVEPAPAFKAAGNSVTFTDPAHKSESRSSSGRLRTNPPILLQSTTPSLVDDNHPSDEVASNDHPTDVTMEDVERTSPRTKLPAPTTTPSQKPPTPQNAEHQLSTSVSRNDDGHHQATPSPPKALPRRSPSPGIVSIHSEFSKKSRHSKSRQSPGFKKDLSQTIGEVEALTMTMRKHGGASRLETLMRREDGTELKVRITNAGDVTVDSRKDEEQPPLLGSGDDTTPVTWFRDYSLWIFHPRNRIRQFCNTVIQNKWFERCVLLLIAVSSIFLALDEPNASPERKAFLLYADMVVTSLFVLEMTLKVIAMGLFGSKSSYLGNGWNILDGIIVVVSVVSLAIGNEAGGSQLKALRSLRALRALRPLRVVSRYPGLKLVVNSIFGALPKVRNVALVNFLFFLIFAIVGVQNFMGALNSCNDSSAITMKECLSQDRFNATGPECFQLPTDEEIDTCRLSIDGLPMQRVWGPPPFHFDNVFNGLLTVWEVATGEMWPDIMYVCVDAVGINQPMERDHNPAVALYFIAIQVVCAFFMLEIFTGVIIDNFNELKAESKGSGLLTKEQQIWVESMKMMLSVRPKRAMRPPTSGPDCFVRFRMVFFATSSSPVFEMCIMILILLNTAALAATHSTQSPEFAATLGNISFVFTLIFAMEAVIKLIGLGIRQYFGSSWNIFDFTLVIGSLVGILFELGSVATLLRVFRVARIFRLVRTSRGLQQLFRTLIFSLPSLVNVGAVLILLFFIYACVGMNLFSGIKHSEFLNSDANFDSFPVAMITLFRMSTGESYNGIMHDCMVRPPFCIEGENCGDTIIAPIYFISFFIFAAFILLNIIVAIILDNFGDTIAMDEAKDGFRLTPDMLEAFQDQWSFYDPMATDHISYNDLVEFVSELDFPLGFRGHPGVVRGVSTVRQTKLLLEELDVPSVEVDGHAVYSFHVILQALTHNATGGEWIRNQVTAPPRLTMEGELRILGGLKQVVAVRKIQMYVRRYLERKRQNAETESYHRHLYDYLHRHSPRDGESKEDFGPSQPAPPLSDHPQDSSPVPDDDEGNVGVWSLMGFTTQPSVKKDPTKHEAETNHSRSHSNLVPRDTALLIFAEAAASGAGLKTSVLREIPHTESAGSMTLKRG